MWYVSSPPISATSLITPSRWTTQIQIPIRILSSCTLVTWKCSGGPKTMHLSILWSWEVTERNKQNIPSPPKQRKHQAVQRNEEPKANKEGEETQRGHQQEGCVCKQKFHHNWPSGNPGTKLAGSQSHRSQEKPPFRIINFPFSTVWPFGEFKVSSFLVGNGLITSFSPCLNLLNLFCMFRNPGGRECMWHE